jgi:hypothetical protein
MKLGTPQQRNRMYVVGDRCNVLNSLAGTVTTGNTMAPCIIIGERAAEAYHGVGESVPVASVNKENLSGAIDKVLGNPCYRDAALRFQRTILQTHGLDRAADVLERAFQFVDESGMVV